MFRLTQQALAGDRPQSRTDALQKLVEDALSHFPLAQGRRGQATETVQALALEMQLAERRSLSAAALFQTMNQVRGARDYELEGLYEALKQAGLLAEIGDGDVRFNYAPIQSYCAAQAILAQPDRDRVLNDVVATIGSPHRLRWWEDTLVLCTGLLAMMEQPGSLRRLLEAIVYGSQLLEGEALFLAARCLLEAEASTDTGLAAMGLDLAPLHRHVNEALRWRARSQNEPSVHYRILVARMLTQVHGLDPAIIVGLARLIYDQVRTNLGDEADYEFGGVRMAAAVGLKRARDPERVFNVLEDELSEMFFPLRRIFEQWKGDDVDGLVDDYQETDHAGLQALAALALGDLAAQDVLQDEQPKKAEMAQRHLVDAFYDPETEQ